MGWFSSSSPSLDETSTKSQASTHVPISQPQELQSSPPSSQPIDHDADFHAAYPHLAPSTPTTRTPPQSPSPDFSTYPTTMSCRAVFDSAFYCSSLGGHFNDIYRYGQLRSCSEHWADWRFCMRLKGTSKERSKELVQERYREKEEKIRAGRNSEDVWRRREAGEEIVRPFAKAEEEGKERSG